MRKGRNISGVNHVRCPRHLRGPIASSPPRTTRRDSGRGSRPTFSWTGHPYRGLQTFEKEDATIFHGRGEEVQEVLERLRTRRLENQCESVVILGSSGSGKSSLARAGVDATLSRIGFTDGVQEWRSIAMLPAEHSSDLFRGLARLLADELPELESAPGGLPKLAERLSGNPEAASDLLESAIMTASEQAGGKVRLLLILDQMEELWTVSHPEELREQLSGSSRGLGFGRRRGGGGDFAR